MQTTLINTMAPMFDLEASAHGSTLRVPRPARCSPRCGLARGVALLALASGCARGSATGAAAPGTSSIESPVAAPPGPPGELRTLRRTPLLFELAGVHSTIPMARGTVHGRDVLLVIDSGASRHVLALWVAREASLAITEAESPLTDAAGRTARTYRVADPEIALERWGPLPDTAASAVEMTPAHALYQLGGSLSPQRMSTREVPVVVDLDRSELRAVTGGDAFDSIADRGAALSPEPLRACRTHATNGGRSFIVTASVDGHPAQLEIDTGAPYSLIFATSEAGRALAPRVVAGPATRYTTSGARLAGRVFQAPLRIGDVTASVDLAYATEPARMACPLDGILGDDVLQYCVLVFAGDRAFGRCEVP